MSEKNERFRMFYVSLTLAISATAFIGFTFTYFSPMAAGTYPSVSPTIHLHGWSFFLWYLLLPLQAVLMATGRSRIHIILGTASLLLAAVMAFTGLLVASIRVQDALSGGNTGPFGAFWEEFGPVITSTLLLFIGFYAAAIMHRGRPDVHKRLMIIASAAPLAAAVYRIIVAGGGYNWLATPAWALPSAFLLPNLFIVAGMIYDAASRRSVHPAYAVGLTISVAVEAAGLWLLDNPAGDLSRQLLAAFGKNFGFFF